ncbi:MAG: hypothetical protein ABSH41_08350 [Syntrophobacteraceae bacterium]
MGLHERQLTLVLPYWRKIALAMVCMALVAAYRSHYQLQFSQFSKDGRGIALSHS